MPYPRIIGVESKQSVVSSVFPILDVPDDLPRATCFVTGKR